MDEKRPENDFRVDNNIARTADNPFGLKEAVSANGGGGETGNFEKVNFVDYTKKYKLLKIDLVSLSEAFITPII